MPWAESSLRVLRVSSAAMRATSPSTRRARSTPYFNPFIHATHSASIASGFTPKLVANVSGWAEASCTVRR